MIDLTLMPEVLNPLSIMEAVPSKLNSKRNGWIWFLIICAVLFVGLFLYVKERDNQKTKINGE